MNELKLLYVSHCMNGFCFFLFSFQFFFFYIIFILSFLSCLSYIHKRVYSFTINDVALLLNLAHIYSDRALLNAQRTRKKSKKQFSSSNAHSIHLVMRNEDDDDVRFMLCFYLLLPQYQPRNVHLCLLVTVSLHVQCTTLCI